MNGVFHQNLGSLRRKRRLSQRQVAGDLYISQALLSHYENGIREPGLDFVNRACTYYGVTADFLLGRTEADMAGALSEDSEGEVKLNARTLIALLQAVSEPEQTELMDSTLRCFGAIAYRLLRHMASADTEAASLDLIVPDNRMTALADMEYFLAEVQFLDCLEQLAAQSEGTPKRLLPEQMEALLVSLDKQIAQSAES